MPKLSLPRCSRNRKTLRRAPSWPTSSSKAGHPRGELIVLQLEATHRSLKSAEAKRERVLIKTARPELLDPLDAVLKPDCTFTRGILSRAALKQGNALARERHREDSRLPALGHC